MISVNKNSSTKEPFYFRSPFTCMLAGPGNGNKIILTYLKFNLNFLFLSPKRKNDPPALIIYCYSQWQDIYDEIKDGRAFGPPIFNRPVIIFNAGLPDLEAIDVEQNTLIILDDLMLEAGRDPKILNIFTTDSHHKNISVIFVTHNIFSNQKHFRTISLNCQYIILTNNPRDRLQITILAKQMFPGESLFFNKAYNDAVSSKQYGYLLVDFTQLTADQNRVQTGVFEEEERIIYRIK